MYVVQTLWPSLPQTIYLISFNYITAVSTLQLTPTINSFFCKRINKLKLHLKNIFYKF